ncbi:GLPGLI family protein [Flavobacterium sp.]|jgi:GLPGLI family protein|uniref:GLPGLI family protein n=1 Tax=Flavobacterium sp. TaxID=239 RepID=UPI0037C18B2E
MTKVVLVSSFLLMGFLAKAQDFQGKAEYFSKRVIKEKVEKLSSETKDAIDPELEKAVKEAMKIASEKQYLLSFNKTECLYEQPEELEKPEAPATAGISVKVLFSGEGKKYLNLKDKICIEEADIFGKEFLIVEPLEKPDWKLLNETKKIGDYNCFKAELTVQVTEKQRNEYEEFLKKEAVKPALFKMDEPKDKVIMAWYTPEIPVSFGPNKYWGLPGLILEINEEETIILCSKVTLSNKEKSKIKVPNTGEKVTQKKFDEIEKKKTDSMKNEDGVIIFER